MPSNNNNKNSNNNYYDQFANLFNANGIQQPNWDGAASIFQETVDAVTKANKTFFDGAQRIAKAQMEFAQEQAQQAANAASKAFSAESPEENLESGSKLAQKSIGANIQNAQNLTKEATDVATKGFDILNKQAAENMNKLSKISQAS